MSLKNLETKNSRVVLAAIFVRGRFHKLICALFAPCAQLLRSFLLARKFGARRKRWAQGAKPFMKSTPGNIASIAFIAPCKTSSFASQVFTEFTLSIAF